jgi:hypothetical protein
VGEFKIKNTDERDSIDKGVNMGRNKRIFFLGVWKK